MKTKIEKYECTLCGEYFSSKRSSKNLFCSQICYKKSEKSASKKPSREKLEKDVWLKPTSRLAEEYGVSEASIRKWCKSMSIDKPPRGYWQKIEAKK